MSTTVHMDGEDTNVTIFAHRTHRHDTKFGSQKIAKGKPKHLQLYEFRALLKKNSTPTSFIRVGLPLEINYFYVVYN